MLGVAGLAAATPGLRRPAAAAAVARPGGAASAKSNAEALIDERPPGPSATTRSATRRSGAARCAAPGDRGRPSWRRRSRRQPQDRARGRPQGRRRGAARHVADATPARARSNLDDPATTLALLKLNAVVGVTRLLRRERNARVDRHPVRALPLHRRRLVRARHRPPARRLGQPRSRTSARSSRSRPTSRRVRQAARRRRGHACARCSRAGDRASSTPSWFSTARRSGPTARRRRR